MLGTTLSFPIGADRRGTLAVTLTDDEIIRQSVADILETRQGERVMLPGYGLPDFLFDVLDATFAPQLSFYLEEQVRNYVTAIETVQAESGNFEDGQFRSSPLPSGNTAAIRIIYTKRGNAVPQELIYPTWRLINGARP